MRKERGSRGWPAVRGPLHAEARQWLDADRGVLEHCHTFLRRRAAGPHEGLFGPESMLWRVLGELPLVGMGVPAVVLQMLHPAIAAGVVEHGLFERDPIGRIRRTLTAAYDFVFGDLERSLALSRRLFLLHSRVVGTTPLDSASSWAGRPYRASDPELALWVVATLLQSLVEGYSALIGPISAADRARLQEEAIAWGAYFAIPPERMPGTVEEFDRYYAGMLEGDTLAMNGYARQVFEVLFHPRLLPTSLDEVWTAGWLPPRWRESIGLRWTPAAARQHALMRAAIRRVAPGLPSSFRHPAAWHQARLRLAVAHGTRTTLTQRWLNRADAVLEARGLDLPTSMHRIDVSEEALSALEAELLEADPG